MRFWKPSLGRYVRAVWRCMLWWHFETIPYVMIRQLSRPRRRFRPGFFTCRVPSTFHLFHTVVERVEQCRRQFWVLPISIQFLVNSLSYRHCACFSHWPTTSANLACNDLDEVADNFFRSEIQQTSSVTWNGWLGRKSVKYLHRTVQKNTKTCQDLIQWTKFNQLKSYMKLNKLIGI